METNNPLDTAGLNAPRMVDKAADAASGAIRSTQGVANQALDRLADNVEGARDQLKPALDRFTKQAEALTRRSIDAVRDSSAQLRDKAAQLSDNTAGRIRDEPLRAVLIAAATGAALMALVVLIGRSGDRA
jgi:ElaB/YqjD/DUF883 family membrane-anchored ribosome-binding protein